MHAAALGVSSSSRICSRRSSNGFAVHCQRCCLPGLVHESPRGLSHNPRSGSGEGFDVPFPPRTVLRKVRFQP
jgi:hypothetical protein